MSFHLVANLRADDPPVLFCEPCNGAFVVRDGEEPRCPHCVDMSHGQAGIYAPAECTCDDPMGLMVCDIHGPPCARTDCIDRAAPDSNLCAKHRDHTRAPGRRSS